MSLSHDARLGQSASPTNSSPAKLRQQAWYRNPRQRRNFIKGVAFVSPWLVSLLVFTIYPVFRTFQLSFTRAGGLNDPVFIGWANYIRLWNELIKQRNFSIVLGNTIYYAILAVPVGIVVALALAIAMNTRIKEIPLYRTIIYLPSVLPAFALALAVKTLADPKSGLINEVLRTVGIDPPYWFGDPAWAKIALVGAAQFGAGGVALIFLAGLKGIPNSLYEAAMLDGASWFNRLRKITIPLMTPIILYNLISGISSGLQVFTSSFIITGGGPGRSTQFLVLDIYKNAFAGSSMGYAAAQSVILFILTIIIAFVVFKTSRRWVHYAMM